MKEDLISAAYNIVVINMFLLDFVLVNPPSPFLIDQTVMPPLGIMYLSSYLKSKGYSVEIFDVPTRGNNELIPESRVTAFTSTTPQYPEAIKCLNLIKYDDTTKVIGGMHATCGGGKCLNDGFDVVCDGEGEYPLETIINSHEMSNIVIKSNPVKDIDSLPFPDRDWKGFEKYEYLINGERATTMITSRACPFSCYYCCNSGESKPRIRSAKNVIDEARIVHDKHGFGAVQLYDDIFTINRKRAIEIGKGFNEIGLKWRCFVHANTVNRELLQSMHDNGCVEIGIGVETGSQRILNTVNKKTKIENIINIHNICHDIGLRIKAFLIIGLPGENYSSIAETIKFLRKARPDDFDYTIYTPFPKTYIWDNADKFDIKFNKNSIDYSKMFFKGKAGEYTSQVSTKELSSNEIEHIRDCVDKDIRKELYGDQSI